MLNSLFIVFLVSILEVFAVNRFPPYIQVCKRQADMFTCLEKNVNLCKPHLSEGIPELHIPPMDPFQLPKVKLQRGTFEIECTDFVLIGLKDFELLEMDANLEGNISFHVSIKFPFLNTSSMYTARGKLLILEMNGSGKATGNVTDLIATFDLTGRKVIRNGLEYIDFKNGKISLDFNGPIFMYFGNLFGKREDLTVATNQIIQDNIKDFVRELQPFMENLILSIMMGTIKPLFRKYSLNELFPK